MKRKILGSLLLTAIIAVSGMISAVTAQDDVIRVYIDGTAVDFSNYDNLTPYIDEGVTFIPIRAIAEGLGLEVTWDEASRQLAL